MKKTKLSILIILCTICSLVFISKAKALESGETFKPATLTTTSISGGKIYEIHVLKKNSKGKYYYDWEDTTVNSYFHDMTIKGKKYELFCIDPPKYQGNTNTKYKVAKTLNANDPKDAALLYVLSSDESYLTKLVAVRILAIYRHEMSNNSQTGALAVNAIEWSGDVGAASIFDMKGFSYSSCVDSSLRIKKACVSNAKSFVTESTFKRAYDVDKSNGIAVRKYRLKSNSTTKAAKKLITDAISYGKKVKDNKIATDQNVVFNQPSANNSYDMVTINNVNKTQREITFSITFKKFNNAKTDPVKVVINPDASGDANHNVTLDKMEYQLTDEINGEWHEFNSSTDFKPLLTKESTVINFRTKVSANITDESEFTIRYNINVDYKNDDLLTGYLLSAVGQDYQRFYVSDKSSSASASKEFSIKWENLPGYCEHNLPDKNNTDEFKKYLKSCCKSQTGFSITKECNKAKEAKNQKDIDKYCTIKQEYCDVCNGTVSIPNSCTEFGDGENVPKCEDNADAVVKDSDNIKLCIVDFTDEADNSYKMTTDQNVETNRYCSVFCKEDYKMSLPLGRWVTAGRSFTMAMSVYDTKSCYTDLINYDLFIKDLNEQKAKIDANSTDPTARMNYKKIMTDYITCATASWDSPIKFNPDITLTYDDMDIGYKDKFEDGVVHFQIATKAGSKEDDQHNQHNESPNNIWLCSGSDVDDYYNQCIGGYATNNVSNVNSITLDNYYDPDTFNKVSLTIPLTKYAKKISFADAIYVPENNLYTQTGTGIIANSAALDGLSNWQNLSTNFYIDNVELEKVGKIPVALKRTTGAYTFNIHFDGIGEYYDSGKTGRLIGDDNSVSKINKNTRFENEYVCSYTINCPECNIGCKENASKRIFCDASKPDPELPTCVDCKSIGDDITEGSLYSVRQVSLNNINPTGRDLGFNLSNLKGRTAIDAIETKGENVYNDTDGNGPDYVVTLTPAEIRKVQAYNDTLVSDGGYSSLSGFNCSNYSDSVVNTEYYDILKKNDYVTCTSDILHGKGEYALSNVEINNSSNTSWPEECDKLDGVICSSSGLYGTARK